MVVSSYFVSVFLGIETLEGHSQLPKKANKCSIGAVTSVSYVWLHRHVHVIPNIGRLSDIHVVRTTCGVIGDTYTLT